MGLSPASVAALQAAQRGGLNGGGDPKAVLAALAEAKQKGINPPGFDWTALAKGLGLAGAFAAPFLLPVVAGGGAAAAGSSSASSAVPAAFAGQIPADVAATGGGGGLFGSILKAAGGYPALISDAGSIVTGAIGAKAAKDSAATLSGAADKALAINRQVYQPYLDAAPGQLNTLLGQINAPRSQFVAPTAGTPGLPSIPAQNAPQATSAPTTGGLNALLGQSATAAPGAVPTPTATPGGMVRLRAPNGEMRMVPAAVAPQFIAEGAQRIG